jgi:hypothetical protein
MHENREIPSTPWSDDQGRSAKATNQTADTHVPEKSDCAVLPVNQPNKEGQSSQQLYRSQSSNPVYGKSLYALSIEGRCSFLSAAVTQSPDGYPAS